jgi:hypothetical protein
MQPKLPSRIGKTSKIKDIHDRPVTYTVVDECVFTVGSTKQKAFCLQKLHFGNGHEEFRICYYMIAQKPRMRGKWAFGQFAPMMTKKQMIKIFRKIKDKGWI